MEYVKRAGFDFTKEEIEKHKSVLSDEELDKVSGGASASPVSKSDKKIVKDFPL